eukprot:TRINITY_DN4117_c0_g1_i5.p1 TRINITY_DN4117_c0_g1~~TRINITY_DN4117_c0_g1_i5.p1  ORF type:complete len:486 (-),score=190.83 TRINITY_DN4117_c0_g1_i5:18-1475(-)
MKLLHLAVLVALIGSLSAKSLLWGNDEVTSDLVDTISFGDSLQLLNTAPHNLIQVTAEGYWNCSALGSNLIKVWGGERVPGFPFDIPASTFMENQTYYFISTWNGTDIQNFTIDGQVEQVPLSGGECASVQIRVGPPATVAPGGNSTNSTGNFTATPSVPVTDLPTATGTPISNNVTTTAPTGVSTGAPNTTTPVTTGAPNTTTPTAAPNTTSPVTTGTPNVTGTTSPPLTGTPNTTAPTAAPNTTTPVTTGTPNTTTPTAAPNTTTPVTTGTPNTTTPTAAPNTTTPVTTGTPNTTTPVTTGTPATTTSPVTGTPNSTVVAPTTPAPTPVINLTWNETWAFGRTIQLSLPVGTTVNLINANQHNLLQVTRAGYDSCDASGANLVKLWGTTRPSGFVWVLPASEFPVGSYYFFCTVNGGPVQTVNGTDVPIAGGHCNSGMKMSLQITEVAVETTTPFASTSAPGTLTPYSALIPCLLYTSPSPRD